MSYLLIGDLHFTDRPRDAYRFGIFDWILQQQEKYSPEATFLMGDLTNQKDRHSAKLVNQIVTGLHQIEPVFVVMGNHDYTDPSNPFFGFLNHTKSIFFITRPDLVMGTVGVIPHTRNEEEFADSCLGLSGKTRMLLIHNTMQGAIAETGSPLNGFSVAPIKQMKLRLGCFAGDVHKPQVAGSVTYVGAPYQVRFGDEYEPRCLLIQDDGTHLDLPFEAPRKHRLTINDAGMLEGNLSLLPGDHVKVTLEMTRNEASDWPTYRQQIAETCKKLELEVFGIEPKMLVSTKVNKADVTSRLPADIVAAYCKAEKTTPVIKKVGLELL